jgi:hypothetical protein
MRITAYNGYAFGYASPQKKLFAAVGFFAVRARFLNWRARNVPIGAKHAAIALPGLKAYPAALAHIEKHACVCRHGFRCAMPTSRARNRRDELHHTSQELGRSAEFGQSNFNSSHMSRSGNARAASTTRAWGDSNSGHRYGHSTFVTANEARVAIEDESLN